MSYTKKIKIYLLNKNINFNNYIEADAKYTKQYVSISKSKMGSNYEKGIIYIFSKQATEPGWANHLRKMATQKAKKFELKKNIEYKAIAFLKVRVQFPDNSFALKTFALTFGGGHHLLNKNYIEKDFANKITRTLVKNENVISLNTVTLDKNIFNTRKNSSKNIPEHKLLNYKEIAFIKHLHGKGELEGKNMILGGSDGLDLTGKFDLNNNEIIKLLVNLGQIFSSNSPEEFNVNELLVPVSDSVQITKLNSRFKNKLKDLVWKKSPIDNRNLRGISLQIPGFIPLGNITNVFITGIWYKDTVASRSNELNALDFFERLRVLNQKKLKLYGPEDIIKKLHHSKIEVTIDNDASSKHSYSVYDSLTMELTLENHTYLLFHSKWYQVNKNFYSNLKDELEKIENKNPDMADLKYPKYHNQREEEWNESFCNYKGNEELFFMDQKFYTFEKELIRKNNLNTYSKIEICDALRFSNENIEFIHVKRKGSASGISHLSNQAFVSATLFNENKTELISEINSAISPEKLDWDEQTKHVTLIILDERFKNDPPIHSVLTILELMALVQNIYLLKNLGYKVYLKGVS
ncbi:DUF6119 family protein [Lysinibacillus fusiformis]|uniref:DUF6119 family protein n=1 Tax=Lysinibacillus fusiformis TaxID=28031 RepID=UPI00119FACFC|nr:DUF6119 family protein [Lysinibacillus fusiformis]